MDDVQRGEELRQRIARQGYSLQQFRQEAGLPNTTLHRLLKGEGSPATWGKATAAIEHIELVHGAKSPEPPSDQATATFYKVHDRSVERITFHHPDPSKVVQMAAEFWKMTGIRPGEVSGPAPETDTENETEIETDDTD